MRSGGGEGGGGGGRSDALHIAGSPLFPGYAHRPAQAALWGRPVALAGRSRALLNGLRWQTTDATIWRVAAGCADEARSYHLRFCERECVRSAGCWFLGCCVTSTGIVSLASNYDLCRRHGSSLTRLYNSRYDIPARKEKVDVRACGWQRDERMIYIHRMISWFLLNTRVLYSTCVSTTRVSAEMPPKRKISPNYQDPDEASGQSVLPRMFLNDSGGSPK